MQEALPKKHHQLQEGQCVIYGLLQLDEKLQDLTISLQNVIKEA